MEQIKPIITIQDLSTFGRCSLAVVLPTISALGVQCCPVPTAVFSTHTGGLGPVTKRDLTDFLSPTLAHYQQLELDFSAIYTGYLGSVEQFNQCLAYFAAYPQAKHIVDPVMGDHGKAYGAYTPEMQQQMRNLVAQAELITPNLTEVCLLLDEPYGGEPLEKEQAVGYIRRLEQKTKGDIIITGVELVGSPLLHNLCYDRKAEKIFTIAITPTKASFPGTGDLFAAAVVGGLAKGEPLKQSVILATKFTALAVSTTANAGTDSRYGVLLESVLGSLYTGEGFLETVETVLD